MGCNTKDKRPPPDTESVFIKCEQKGDPIWWALTPASRWPHRSHCCPQLGVWGGSDNLWHSGTAFSAKAFTAFSQMPLLFPFLVTFWEDESFGKWDCHPTSQHTLVSRRFLQWVLWESVLVRSDKLVCRSLSLQAPAVWESGQQPLAVFSWAGIFKSWRVMLFLLDCRTRTGLSPQWGSPLWAWWVYAVIFSYKNKNNSKMPTK